MLQDIRKNLINVGDIVVFTEPGAGRNLPGLKTGEVVGLTKAGVRIQYVDDNYRRLMREEYIDDLNDVWYTRRNGELVYKKVPSGNWVEKEPVNVRYYDDRFLIVGKA